MSARVMVIIAVCVLLTVWVVGSIVTEERVIEDCLALKGTPVRLIPYYELRCVVGGDLR